MLSGGGGGGGGGLFVWGVVEVGIGWEGGGASKEGEMIRRRTTWFVSFCFLLVLWNVLSSG